MIVPKIFFSKGKFYFLFCFGYLKGKGKEPVDWNRKDCKYKKARVRDGAKSLKLERNTGKGSAWEWTSLWDPGDRESETSIKRNVGVRREETPETVTVRNGLESLAMPCQPSQGHTEHTQLKAEPQRTEETVSLAGTWNSVLPAFFA